MDPSVCQNVAPNKQSMCLVDIWVALLQGKAKTLSGLVCVCEREEEGEREMYSGYALCQFQKKFHNQCTIFSFFLKLSFSSPFRAFILHLALQSACDNPCV